MVLYFSLIFFFMALISLINILCSVASWYYVIIAVVWCTAFQFLTDGLGAMLVHKLPDRWFSVDNAHFTVSKRAVRFYEKLGVRKWKDKVWELGGMGGFSKNKIAEPNNPEYFEQFIIECNKGVVNHRISYFTGFLDVFILPFSYALSIAVPVAVVNALLNMLPTIILRYNVPKLTAVRNRLLKIQQRQKSAVNE